MNIEFNLSSQLLSLTLTELTSYFMSHYYLVTYEAIFGGKSTTINKIMVYEGELNKHQIKDIIKEERKASHPDQTGEEIVIIIFRKITEEKYQSLLHERKN